jgi:hypothetical protein
MNMNKDEAVKIAYTIAADVISPDHIEAIINEHQHLLSGSEHEKQLVAEALRDVQLELQEKAEEIDVMTPEEEAEIDAVLDKYRRADGKLDFDKLRAEAVTLKAEDYPELAAVFPEMFPQEVDDGKISYYDESSVFACLLFSH